MIFRLKLNSNNQIKFQKFKKKLYTIQIKILNMRYKYNKLLRNYKKFKIK